MGVRFSRNKHYKTETIVSDEEKWQRLQELLGNKLSDEGQLFKPDDNFYAQNLVGMAQLMFEFVGVNVGKDKLNISLSSEIEPPGLYYEQDGVHYILIKRTHANNVMECAAILAHELMHYVLIGGFNFRLAERLDNEQLTDMATVFCGLGLVVLNGFDHEGNNWFITIAALAAGAIRYSSKSMSFGYYKPKQYAELVGQYIEVNDVPDEEFAGYVAPGAAHFLPSPIKSAIRQADDRTAIVERTKRGKFKSKVISSVVAIVALIVIVAIRGAFGGSSPSGVSPQVQQQAASLKTNADSLNSQLNDCNSQLSSDKSTLDQTNSQMDTDNTDGDTTDYNNLVPQQNQETQTYNSELSSCQSLESQYNSAVSTYNSYINQNQ